MGLPELMTVVTNAAQKPDLRQNAILALMCLETNACPAIPKLIEAILTINDRHVWAAYYTLGQLKLEPRLVTAAWNQALESTNKYRKYDSIIYLSSFDEAAKPVIPALQRALNSEDEFVRVYSYNALRHLAPEVLTNVVPPEPPRAYGSGGQK